MVAVFPTAVRHGGFSHRRVGGRITWKIAPSVSPFMRNVGAPTRRQIYAPNAFHIVCTKSLVLSLRIERGDTGVPCANARPVGACMRCDAVLSELVPKPRVCKIKERIALSPYV